MKNFYWVPAALFDALANNGDTNNAVEFIKNETPGLLPGKATVQDQNESTIRLEYITDSGESLKTMVRRKKS